MLILQYFENSPLSAFPTQYSLAQTKFMAGQLFSYNPNSDRQGKNNLLSAYCLCVSAANLR